MASEAQPDTALPAFNIALKPEQIIRKLDDAARRGNMPGFQPGGGTVLFTLSDFGTPFESVLHADGTDAEGGTRVVWRVTIKWRLPIVFAVLLIASVWPGVWLTDSMLKTYFSGYDFATWKWYLPLTVPFVPWAMWTAVRRSRDSARVEAASLVEKVRAVLGTDVIG